MAAMPPALNKKSENTMNPRHLKHFLRVAELGSLSKAALVLYIAQPALSRQMTELEHSLGATLLQRSERGVSLTDAGKRLQRRAEAILQDLDDLRRELSQSLDTPAGRLDVLVTPSLSALICAPAVARFVKRYPTVELNVSEAASGVVHAWSWILDDRVSFAVGTTLEPMADMFSWPFAREPLCLFGPADAGLSLAEPQPLERLTQVPLWLPLRSTTIRLILEARLAAARLQLHSMCSATSPALLVSAVSRGEAWTVLPYCSGAREHQAGLVSAAPLQGTVVTWNFVSSRNRPLPAAAAAFQSVWRETVQAQIDDGRWPTAELIPAHEPLGDPASD